jgi:hypothetical protein
MAPAKIQQKSESRWYLVCNPPLKGLWFFNFGKGLHMKIFSVAAFVLFSVGCVAIPVNAACGGGGWHKSNSQSVSVASAPSSTTSYESQNVAYSRSSDRSGSQVYLNTSRFDSASSQMRLSDQQWKDVRVAEDDIRSKARDLSDAKVRAEASYARCTGNCDVERRNLARAQSAYNNFSPSTEFDRRLSAILNDKQMAIYHQGNMR